MLTQVIVLEHHPALWIKIFKMHIACIIFCSTHRSFEVMPIQGFNNLVFVDTPTRRAVFFLPRLLFCLANACTFSFIRKKMFPRLLMRYVSAAVITRHRHTEHRINFRIQTGLSRINTYVTIFMSLECMNQPYSSYLRGANRVEQRNREFPKTHILNSDFLERSTGFGCSWIRHNKGNIFLVLIFVANRRTPWSQQRVEFTTMATGRAHNSLY